MRRTFMRFALVTLVLACSSPVVAQENAMYRADQAYAAGDFTTAELAYQQIVDSYPGNPIAWLRLARIHAARKQWPDAVTAFQTLATLGPLDSDVRLEYADALRESGNLELAISQYNLVLESGPDGSVLAQADFAFQSGNLTEAQRLYEAIISEYPAHEIAWRRMGQIHAQRRDWNRAITAYETLTGLGFNSADVHLEYGDILRESGDLEQALIQYNMVVSGGDAPVSVTASQPGVAKQAPQPEFTQPRPAAAVTPPMPDSSVRISTANVPSTPAPAPASEPVVPQASPSFEPQSPQALTTGIQLPATQPVEDGTYIVREVNRAELLYPEELPSGSLSVFYMQREEEESDGDSEDESVDDADRDWLEDARIYAAYGDWEAAVDAYEKLIEQGEISIEIRIEYADALRESGDITGAEQQYNRVIQSHPDNIEAKIGLAKTLALGENLEEAMYLLDQLSMDAASMRQARLARAYCYFVNGYIHETWADIGEVLALNPQNREAVAILQSVEMGPEDWDYLRSLLTSVEGNEDVLELIDAVIEAEREVWLALPADQYDRAEALFLRGKFDQALIEYEQLARNDPMNARIWMRLGTMYQWEEDWAESLTAYETYLRLAPDDYEARLRYAQALLYSGDPAEARDELESIINAVDIPIDIYEQALPVYAAALNALGLYDRALSWYEEALVFDPHNAVVRNAYADTLAGQGMHDRAEIQYNLVLRDDPTNEAARMGLGRSYAWQGDYGRAQEQYDSLPMDSPNYAASRIGKAYTYLWQGSAQRARQLADEAARLDPHNPELAVLYESLRQTPGAGVTPSIVSTWRQSHDSDDNDTSSVLTTVTTPLGDGDSVLVLTHDDFKLDNTTRGEETAGTQTRVTLATPLSESADWRISTSYLNLDNAADPAVDNWNWGTSISFRMSDTWVAGVGYSEQTMFDTTELARNDIGINEVWVNSDVVLNDNTRLNAIYSYGDLSDGNERSSIALNLRRSEQFPNRGRLQYGIIARQLAYSNDMANGYWDPHNYRFGEVYLDWLDMSDNPILFDAGVGLGLDKETGGSVNSVYRYNVGLRKPLLNNRLQLRTGYAASEAATNATAGPGYEFEAWYLSGEYAF